MNRLMIAAAVLLSCIGLTACDESTATTSSAATFTFVPATATAVENTDDKTYTIVGDSTHADRTIRYPWKTTFNVNIKETAGVGRNIAQMALKVQQASGGIVITPTGTDIEHYDYTSHASGNRIEKNGSADVSFDVWYDLPNKGREALITISFSFTDDNNASFSETASVKVM